MCFFYFYYYFYKAVKLNCSTIKLASHQIIMSFPSFLRIAIMPLRHAIEFDIDETDKVTFTGGVESLFVEILSKVLGFRYQLFIPDDRQWGRLSEEGNWTGMIGMVQHNKTDIAIGDLTITESRTKVVDFIPYSIEETTFATRLPKEIIRHTFYVQPFRYIIWLMCLLAVIISPFVFWMGLKKRMPFTKLLFAMIGNILNQPLSFSIIAARDKLLFGFWILFSFLLSSSYTALLLSSLTIPAHEHGVRTLRGLSAAVAEGRYTCMTNLGSAYVDILTESPSKHLRILGKNIIQKKWLSSSQAIIAPLEIGETEAILGPRWFFLLEYGEAPFTTKYLFREAVAVWNIGIAVNKGFCCKEELRAYITRMFDVGIFSKLYSDELFKTRLQFMSKGAPRTERHQALSLDELLGAFFLWFGGCCLAIIVQIFITIRQALIKKCTLRPLRRRR